MESFFLNIEAVNTHRERPGVSFHKHTFVIIDTYLCQLSALWDVAYCASDGRQ